MKNSWGVVGLCLASLSASAQAPLAFEMDERLSMPRSYIAADIGDWSNNSSVTQSRNLWVQNPSGSGLRGIWYEECLQSAKLWHVQHVVRLPNKNGEAYFMMSNSDYAGDGRGGFLSLMKFSADRVDENDLIIANTQGGDAEKGTFIWEDQFNDSNPIGYWNHPARMEVVGGLLVVAMENFDPFGCSGGNLTSEDALVFYDIRDPEHPRHLATIPSTGRTVNSVGILNPRNIFGTLTVPSWVISVTDNFWGHTEWCTLSILPHTLLPSTTPVDVSFANDPFDWYPCSVPPDEGGGFAGQYGMLFNSFEMRKDSLDDDCRAVPGGPQTCRESSFRFLPLPEELGSDDKFEFAQIANRRVVKSSNFVVDLPSWNRHWEDMSAYVTRNGMVVAYGMNNSLWSDSNECDWLPGYFLTGYPSACHQNAKIVQMHNVADVPLRTPLQSQQVISPVDELHGTLREAISHGGTVTFNPGLNGATITLAKGPLVAYLYDVTIDASALPDGITISGGDVSRVFEVGRGVNVTLKNVTLRDGRALQGAGLRNMGGTVTLENCRVIDNEATWPWTNQGIPSNAGDGGGILNGALQWRDPADDNELMGRDAGGNLTLINTTVSGNTARRGGGGIANLGGVLTVESSTISGNIAYGGGGGLLNTWGRMDATTTRPATVRLLNSTVANNTVAAEARGTGTAGIENRGGDVTLVRSLVAGNSMPSEGLYTAAGIANLQNGTLTLEHSVVAHNVVQYQGGYIRDVEGAYCSLVDNLFTNSTGSVAVISGLCNVLPARTGDPRLGPLGDYGGPTETMLPLAGPPSVIDRADIGTLPPTDPVNLFDQRGVSRPQGAAYDTGPVEAMPLAPAIEATEVSAVASTPLTNAPAPWFGQPFVTHDGVDAAQSGPSGDLQSSGLTASVTGPGTLTFWWKVSSAGGDPLFFMLDGSVRFSIDGEVDWTPVTISIPSGSHSLAWVYLKNAAGAAGEDAGWLDQVVFTHPPTIVTNANDTGAGSLRNIITGLFPGDVITMGAGLSGQTITLTSGQIAINKAVSIDASALPGGLTLSGNDTSRVFDVASGGNLTLTGVSIVRGRVGANDLGGCLRNAAGGTLTLRRSTVSDCRAGATAPENGQGGGIGNSGTLVLDHSTITRNAASGGAGVRNYGTTTLVHTTIAGNNSYFGGIGGGFFGPVTTLNIAWSIIAGNTAQTSPSSSSQFHPDISCEACTIGVTGPSLIGSNYGAQAAFAAGPLVGTNAAPLDARLAPLGNFGGPTKTMLPLAGSPAVDAATGSTVAVDQRNVVRPQGAARDLGSVEVRSTDRSDGEGDGVADGFDNCTLVANPTQLDTDRDGYGNICDADFNRNGIVDSQDGALLKSRFGSSAYPDQDLNGNGIVDSNDGARLKANFGRPPGPSGLVP